MALYDLSKLAELEPGQLTAFAQARFRDEIENPTRLGERLLPTVDVDAWDVATDQFTFRSVAMPAIGTDSELPRGPLGKFKSQQYALLKLGMKQEMIESEIIKLAQALGTRRFSVDDWANSPPYRFAANLTNAYLDRMESWRWQALATGTIAFRSDAGVAGEIVYNVPATHQDALTGTSAWSDLDDADGLADLMEWDNQVYTDTGRHIEVWVMRRADFQNLMAQDATRTRLQNVFGSTGQQINAGLGNTVELGLSTQSNINAYLSMFNIGPIVLYDRLYQEYNFTSAADPVPTPFLPDHHVVGIAPRPIDGGVRLDGVNGGSATGYTANGPTLESAVRGGTMTSGIYIWPEFNMEPVDYAIKAVAWSVPVLTDTNTLFQATVEE